MARMGRKLPLERGAQVHNRIGPLRCSGTPKFPVPPSASGPPPTLESCTQLTTRAFYAAVRRAFPCKLPRNREIVVETSSQLTVSTATNPPHLSVLQGNG